MSRILITGASGLLGRAVCERFQVDHEVIPCGFQHGRAGLERIDIRDHGAWRSFLRQKNPDAVVHCAAYRDPDFCEKNPEEAYRLNVEPLHGLLEELPSEVPVMFISSDFVFDGEAPPYAEEADRRPVNLYGETKKAGENLVLARAGGTVLRIPLLIGSGPTWEDCGFVYQTVKLIRSSNPAILDHAGTRYPTWVKDVADGIHWLMANRLTGVFHLSGQQGKTKYGWAQEIAGFLGESMDHIKPTLDQSIPPARRPRDTHLSIGRLQAAGYTGLHDVLDAVREILLAHGQI